MSQTYAKILLHSKTEYNVEAITWELRFPRIILSEFLTHRLFSRNTSSSRAIPIHKLIRDIWNDPFIPVYWGGQKAGMQAGEELTGLKLKLAKTTWKTASKIACGLAWSLDKIGLHKQITNRLIENFGYVTVVMTTTNMSNFLGLRNHKDAQPEIHHLAGLMYEEYIKSEPELLLEGQWHLPYAPSPKIVYDHDAKIVKNELSEQERISISVARCASTSYKTVDGKDMTIDRALGLFKRLLGGDIIHASPAEHQLKPDRKILVDKRPHGSKKKYVTVEEWEHPELHGNTTGFIQFRKTLPNEFIGA